MEATTPKLKKQSFLLTKMHKMKIKMIIKHIIPLAVFYYLINNILLRIKYALSLNTKSGATHYSLNSADSIKYIEEVFFDYQRLAGRESFSGRIAELGPGDNDGVALLFLANGATHVDLADRFFSKRNNEKQIEIINILKNKYPAINLIEAYENKRLERHFGTNASGENFFENCKPYDFIISRSVLEHVDLPEKVLRSMYKALKKGGTLLNKVDLRDHGMFTPYGPDIKFLEINPLVYSLMVQKIGYPNRFLFHQYKKVLRSLPNSRCEFFVAGLHGVDVDLSQGYPYESIPLHIRERSIAFIDSRKPKFSYDLRFVESHDLSVSSFFFVLQKI